MKFGDIRDTLKTEQNVVTAENASNDGSRVCKVNTSLIKPEINQTHREPVGIETLDLRAPRYTSYPTADQFHKNFNADSYIHHLRNRQLNPLVPLSVYVHIPFCESLCHYCACNKVITRQYSKASRYIKVVVEELSLIDQYLTGDRKLLQMHWGGGTPTYLNLLDLSFLMTALRSRFRFIDKGEYSIEIDPRTVDSEKLKLLKDLGFNRISLGVQDFDLAVQSSINRIQSVDLVQSVLDQVRHLGFRSTNFDLIYGLPEQSLESFYHTIQTVISMRPERIALYNYAHLPKRFKAQRLIDTRTMPSAETKMRIFKMANEALDAAGYSYIGMDHFALPEDDLSNAHRMGRLHRNFQGYSTQPDCDIVALGASAISRVGGCYSQNKKRLNEYAESVGKGILPTERGLNLDQDDILRRAIIMAIMCNGEVDKRTIETSYLIEFDQYFADELNDLKPLGRAGLVLEEDNYITVTDKGRRKALRAIGSVFDRYLGQQQARSKFSTVY